MNIIPIQIVVDGDEIIKTHGSGGTIDAPISLGNHTPLVYMFANNQFVSNADQNTQGTSALKVTAQENDAVEWRVEAVDRTNYSPLLARFKGDSDFLLTPARLEQMDLKYYIPADAYEPDNGVIKEEATDVVMRSVVLGTISGKPKTVVYTWVFKLLNRVGKTLGYYQWDPRIIVSN